MKLYVDPTTARSSDHIQLFLPLICPFSPGEATCGNWCPHFTLLKDTPDTYKGVNITCGYHAVVYRTDGIDNSVPNFDNEVTEPTNGE